MPTSVAYLRQASLIVHCSLSLGGKWAESPMVCSPGQSDRRERRPGCMPIYLAAATRQWVYHGSSSYHVGAPLPTAGRAAMLRRVILPCGCPLPTAALPTVALPQAIQRRAFSPILPWVFPTDRASALSSTLSHLRRLILSPLSLLLLHRVVFPTVGSSFPYSME